MVSDDVGAKVKKGKKEDDETGKGQRVREN